MRAVISPSKLVGSIDAIPSKSDAHRCIICAALADTPTEIEMTRSSEDIEATIGCVSALGARVERKKGLLRITPAERGGVEMPQLDCGECGATLRFLLPVAAALGSGATFVGGGRLPERPIAELADVLSAHGAELSAVKLPFSISGRLRGGEYRIAGNVSSQYISGLLMALPLLEEDSRIILTTPLESAAYVDMTLCTLKKFGICVKREEGGFFIPGAQRFCADKSIRVEGDWSNALFFLASGAISGGVTVEGLDPDSAQGDKSALGVLLRFGAEVALYGKELTVKAAPLRGIKVDVSDMPDSLPALAVVAAFAAGDTLFTGAARLRLKESDRLETTATMLRSLGGEATITHDGMIVKGKRLTGGSANSFGDHRIAMAAAVAACGASGAVFLENATAVNKSYPEFFDDFKKLGGDVDVVPIR